MTQLQVVDNSLAKLNVTWGGQTGDLPDPIDFQATDAQVRTWVTEAVQGGGVPGISADASADFRDFVVERYSATNDRPWNVIMVRPKTPFGA